MAELGKVLPRLIYVVAMAPNTWGPILFSKLNIKDGYWCTVVPPDDKWHFAYMLPKLHVDEPTLLVVLSCLQMDWMASLPYFCATSETAQDVGKTLALQPPGMLPEYPLEHHLVLPTMWHAVPDDTTTKDLKDSQMQKFLNLMEVYVNNFIQLTQTMDPDHLLHLSHALLYAIHSIFPPPSVTRGSEEIQSCSKHCFRGTASGRHVRKSLVGVSMGSDGALSYCWAKRTTFRVSYMPYDGATKCHARTLNGYRANSAMSALACQLAESSWG